MQQRVLSRNILFPRARNAELSTKNNFGLDLAVRLNYNDDEIDLAVRHILLYTSKEGAIMAITDAKSFGEAVRKRRKDLGYTQAFLSEFSGMSVTFISDLENGKRTIELEKAIRLANLLGLDINLSERD